MRYYIIAGEASGDLHGSNLMKGIYAEDPEAEIRFWGGDLMLDAWGRERNRATPLASKEGLVRHYKEGAVMGFVEVLMKARRLLQNVSFCKEDILSWNPDVVILIDYPGFNFKIAEFAHKAGFKVFYYIAPKVWASRESRIKKLKAYVDKLFIVFPFEKQYFDSKGIDYIYKGNPLVDAVDNSIAMNEPREDFLKRNHLEDKPIIAMLAGSRKGEISTMMPVLTEFASKMHSTAEYADYQFIVAGAPSRSMCDYEKWLTDENRKYVKVIFGETQSVIRHAEAGVINSGTASLETALFGTPQVVGYITNPITYWIAKKIIKIRYISLGNLIVDRLAFKEFIQNDCNADALVLEIRDLIENQERRNAMLKEYAEIRNLLGDAGASSAVAKSMIEELQKDKR
ncbi:MAG: lipid-A-disaccharide synthase [Bacteroidales bacterium]|nr:lipid-A-disaccharide synthase [Bacteroidales bacterium]